MLYKENFLRLSYSAKVNNPQFYALLEALFLGASSQLRRFGPLENLHDIKTGASEDPPEFWGKGHT